MRRLLARLIPRRDTHLLMARELGQPIAELPCAAGFSAIQDISRGDFKLLGEFCDEIEFGADWAKEMLESGARALLALDGASGRAIAMAWTTSRPFHVEEIGATLDPRGGHYLFGDFVVKEFRGRGLQRALVNRRIAALSAAGATTAITIVHPNNVPSVRSYQREGFSMAATLKVTSWMGRRRHACATVTGAAIRLGMVARHTVAPV